MSTSIQRGLWAMAAASLIGLPTLSTAAMVEDTAMAPDSVWWQASPHDALDFLSRTLSHGTEGSRDALMGNAAGGDNDTDDARRAWRLGFGDLVKPPARLRGDVDLFLWDLLSIVHVQRSGKPFELADRGIDFVLTYHANQPSAVPLPGALWLFVMGLLGLVGTRVTGMRASAPIERQRAPEPNVGAAVPA